MKEEQSLQASVVSFIRMRYPHLVTIISPIHKLAGTPKQQMIQAMTRKRMGYTAGSPDLFLPMACRGYHGLFIELKTDKGKASKEQNQVLQKLANQGYKAVICIGYEDAIKTIEDYIL